jgi:hypothetical protein
VVILLIDLQLAATKVNEAFNGYEEFRRKCDIHQGSCISLFLPNVLLIHQMVTSEKGVRTIPFTPTTTTVRLSSAGGSRKKEGDERNQNRKKNIQHPGFPGGLPPQYYPGRQ